MSDNSAPELLSFIVADDVRMEIGGKLTIVGMYLNADLDYIPKDEQKQLYVVAAVRGISAGDHKFHVEIQDIIGKRRVVTDSSACTAQSEKAVVLLVIKIQDFYFPNSGAYRFKLFVDENLVVSYPIRVTFDDGRAEEGGGEDASTPNLLDDAAKADHKPSRPKRVRKSSADQSEKSTKTKAKAGASEDQSGH